MTTPTNTDQSQIEHLIAQLGSDAGDVRQKAREALVEIGGMGVTRALVYELNDPGRDVRWEATKALVSIADPIAAPALVHHLQDEEGDIRWLAAEGLASLGDAGLLATLNASTRCASDSGFCKAAHHAFKQFARQGRHGQLLAQVIEACEFSEPGVSLPVAAYQAIQKIKTGKTVHP